MKIPNIEKLQHDINSVRRGKPDWGWDGWNHNNMKWLQELEYNLDLTLNNVRGRSYIQGQLLRAFPYDDTRTSFFDVLSNRLNRIADGLQNSVGTKIGGGASTKYDNDVDAEGSLFTALSLASFTRQILKIALRNGRNHAKAQGGIEDLEGYYYVTTADYVVSYHPEDVKMAREVLDMAARIAGMNPAEAHVPRALANYFCMVKATRPEIVDSRLIHVWALTIADTSPAFQREITAEWKELSSSLQTHDNIRRLAAHTPGSTIAINTGNPDGSMASAIQERLSP